MGLQLDYLVSKSTAHGVSLMRKLYMQEAASVPGDIMATDHEVAAHRPVDSFQGSTQTKDN